MIFSIIGYVLKVDFIYPNNFSDKNKNFQVCQEDKIINPDKLTEYMKEHIPSHINLLVK